VSGKTTSIPLRLELRQPRCCDASIRPIRLEASCHVLILGQVLARILAGSDSQLSRTLEVVCLAEAARQSTPALVNTFHRASQCIY